MLGLGMYLQSTPPCRKWQPPLEHFLLLLLFQSTLPCRKWPLNWYDLQIGQKFQSTLPCRKWPGLFLYLMHCIDFNPHFRVGSDHIPGWRQDLCRGFQSTLPCRKWPSLGFLGFQPTDFNPHFRVGSDEHGFINKPKFKQISIHTSV